MTPEHHNRLRRRSQLSASVRAHFATQGFLEVDTPIAIAAPAPEPYIDAVPVQFKTVLGTQHRFLQTSPELAMKRLVASGLGPIFQIAPCFRDGDLTAWHRPEFRLLEWYRPTTDYLDLVADVMRLLRHVVSALGFGTTLTASGQSACVAKDPIVHSVEAVFYEQAGLSLQSLHKLEDFKEALLRKGRPVAPTDSWSDLFHRVFLEDVEPYLKSCDRPVFLKEFPAPLASLAKLCPGHPHVAERVEVYVRGIELANGFGELTCSREQEERFVADNAERVRLGKTAYPLDGSFLAAVETMPQTAGMALGMDRLHMLIEGTTNLDEVAFISWL